MGPGREFDVWEEEPIPPEPADGETIPAEAAGSTLDLPAPFHLALRSPDPLSTAQEPSNSMHAPTSKRPGEPLVTSPNKEKRTSEDPEESDLNVDLAYFGIPAGADDHIRLDVTIEVRENAIVHS